MDWKGWKIFKNGINGKVHIGIRGIKKENDIIQDILWNKSYV